MISGLSCWDGYKRVPGTKPGSKGSCVKSSGPSLRKTTKGKGRNFLSVKEGAGMTAAGRKKYKAENPGSTLSAPVTGDVKPGSKAAKRRKSFCARSKSWTGERGKAARKRWKC
tara:strand:+ start:49 stop:387 length:339 start_codon:yes stop_codon:yes gene_type:complete